MKNIIFSNIFLAGTLLWQKLALARDAFSGAKEVSNALKGSNETVDVVVQYYISRILGFLALIAILYCLYGGFLIFTATGDDEKVNKGKGVIIRSMVAILIIFLAYSIVAFLISIVTQK